VKYFSKLTLLGMTLFLSAGSAQAKEVWQSYTDYWDEIINKVDSLDLYGITAQVPQGIFSFKMEYNHRRAAGRYNKARQRTAIVEPITFGGDPENPLLMMDLGASGSGGGMTMQFSYGISDFLNFYFELPFQFMEVQMRPSLIQMNPLARALLNSYTPSDYPVIEQDWFDANGMTLAEYHHQAAEWFLNYLPRLGRPSMNAAGGYPQDLGPGKSYNSNGWVLADINLGFSWNYYRSKHWSGGLTGRMYFPTGGLADPNNSLTLGTGPEIDRGTGALGIGFSKGYDVRLFRYKHWIDVIVSGEFTAAYYFKSKRRYPDFPKPTADGESLLALLDPERMYFPDMSDLTGQAYAYTPGLGCDAKLALGVNFLFFTTSASLAYSYKQEPEINADIRFETMVRNLEMQLAGHYEIMRLSAGINLIPFYIPLEIHYQYEKVVGGRNVLIFDQNHWLTVKGYLPTAF
jgi:hypothetical protein